MYISSPALEDRLLHHSAISESMLLFPRHHLCENASDETETLLFFPLANSENKLKNMGNKNASVFPEPVGEVTTQFRLCIED